MNIFKRKFKLVKITVETNSGIYGFISPSYELLTFNVKEHQQPHRVRGYNKLHPKSMSRSAKQKNKK